MTDMADSRRGADVNLHRLTSLSKEPYVPRGLRDDAVQPEGSSMRDVANINHYTQACLGQARTELS